MIAQLGYAGCEDGQRRGKGEVYRAMARQNLEMIAGQNARGLLSKAAGVNIWW